jgi:hypothetical protein
MAPTLETVAMGMFGHHTTVITVAIFGGCIFLGTVVFTLGSLRFSPRSIAITGNTVEVLTWFILAAMVQLRLMDTTMPPPSLSFLIVLAVAFGINGVASFAGITTFLPLAITENAPLAVRTNIVGIAMTLSFVTKGAATMVKGSLICRARVNSMFVTIGTSVFTVVRAASCTCIRSCASTAPCA